MAVPEQSEWSFSRHRAAGVHDHHVCELGESFAQLSGKLQTKLPRYMTQLSRLCKPREQGNISILHHKINHSIDK